MAGILFPQMMTANTDHDMLDSDRVVVGVFAPRPPPGCVLGHILRHARPFDADWASGSTVEPGFVVTQRGHYTKIHMDVGRGPLVHFVASGTKVWILLPPTPGNLATFRTREWGHSSDTTLEEMCMKAGKIAIVITRPGSLFSQPANWLHAVITVHADAVAMHTTLEIVHLPSVQRVVENIIPPIVRSLSQYNTTPDQEWVEDILKLLCPDNVLEKIPRESVEQLSRLLEGVTTKPRN